MSLLSTYRLSQGGPSSQDMNGRAMAAIWKYAAYVINDPGATQAKKDWAVGANTNAASYAATIWPLAVQDVNFGSAMLAYAQADEVAGDAIWQPIVEAKLAEVWSSYWV